MKTSQRTYLASLTYLPFYIPLFLLALHFVPLDIQAQTKVTELSCMVGEDKLRIKATLLKPRLLSVEGANSSQKVEEQQHSLKIKASKLVCRDITGDGFKDLFAVSAKGKREIITVKPAYSENDLKRICKSARLPYRNEIYKSRQSDHFSPSDPRNPSTGLIYRKGQSAPKTSCLYAYDTHGNLIHKLGRYEPAGAEWSARFYGGHGCGDRKTPSQISSLAKSNTGKPGIVIPIGSGKCLFIPDANRCINSSSC